MKDKKKINICLCTKDDYYIKYTASLIESLHNNKNNNYQYIIYILWWELSEKTKNNLNLIDNEFIINYISFDDVDIFDKYKNITKKEYVYLYRLLIWDFLSDNDRIIYMDNDIIINWDISDLFNVDLWDKIVWASLDCINWSLYTKKTVQHYFNSWLLVIDIKKWNTYDIWHKVLDLINNEKILFPDQSWLNYILDWKWKIISPKRNWIGYNSLSNKWSQYTKQQFYELNHPIICHFAWNHNRPRWWLICMHPKRYLYYKNIFKTPYWDKSDVYKIFLRIFTSNFITRFIYKTLRYFFSNIALKHKYWEMKN